MNENRDVKPFDAAEFLDSEAVILETLRLTTEDDEMAVTLSTIGDCQRAMTMHGIKLTEALSAAFFKAFAKVARPVGVTVALEQRATV